jgi:hypothetical protein
MTISRVIELLRDIEKLHGDIPVCVLNGDEDDYEVCDVHVYGMQRKRVVMEPE